MATKDYRALGIHVMLITGYEKGTSQAICHEIGAFSPDDDVSIMCITGNKFVALADKKALV